MPEIKVTPLGAGQDVGRSCILVSIGGKNIMLDCGMHMGYNDDRRFPDFSYITQNGRLTDFLDCVIISHFHLDHCGALPYMSEMVGYDGPIYMTHPTKAICPILLEDFRKITVDKKGETNFFTSQMIKDCMKKVVPLNLHQTVQVDDELELKAYYAGHVLGAAMVLIKVGSESVVYTGDYNMTPDRHLGAAWIDKCRPDILISESTYATTIRDSKRCRERDFLKKVHESIERGGKGENEPEGSDLLLHGADGESQSLLQALHHLDQSEDPENLCPEEHVRVQAHQGLRPLLRRQSWTHGDVSHLHVFVVICMDGNEV
uniref:Cleavage and polyadenylation-specific factor 3-like protein n=1 Tax=Gouania willdenowi TaxID=441366 RepID=A0A8C5E8E1_GOUWI